MRRSSIFAAICGAFVFSLVASGTSAVAEAPAQVASTSATSSAAAQAAAVSKPFGRLDVVKYVPGGIGVRGWAARQGVQKTLNVHIFLDGKRVKSLMTNEPRKDISNKYPGIKSTTGFSGYIPLSLTGGTHQVCAFAIRPAGTAGTNPNIGCKSFTVTDSPDGTFGITDLGTRDIQTVGQVGDPNVPGAIRVHVYLDGKPLKAATANLDKIRVVEDGKVSYYATYGHGFDIPVRLPNDNQFHQLCTIAINVAGTPGDNVTGCLSVTAQGAVSNGQPASAGIKALAINN